MDCGSLSISNGQVLLMDTTYNNMATLTCSPGYVLDGPETVQCLSSGSWTKSGQCNRKLTGDSMSPTPNNEF